MEKPTYLPWQSPSCAAPVRPQLCARQAGPCPLRPDAAGRRCVADDVARTARFEDVALATTELFPFNSATLNMPQQRLDKIAAALAADPSITDVDITGHADRLGSEQYNLKLSERRANAVRDYLVRAASTAPA